jgi:predicted ester cyclase
VSKSRFGCVNRSHLWLASAAVTAQFVPLISAFPDWHWEIRHIVVHGENIAVHFTATGTHRGLFQGIEATGRRVIRYPVATTREPDAPHAGHKAKVGVNGLDVAHGRA